MIRKNIILVLLSFGFLLSVNARDRDIVAIRSLVERLLPDYKENFSFRKVKAVNGKDIFRLEASTSDKIVIAGNNANSMAMGLNYYLKYYCLTTVSWYSDIAIEMPETLPPVPIAFTSESKVERRFFLNYCTYGYTMPFWDWKDWERFIDWMALNGVNMPLAITGQEAIWYNVWKKIGLGDEEIRSYFTGPTYLPWHRMANIDGWNGPLPMHWIENQKALQKQILTRERELNMIPVLPAFSGHVPAALKRLYPDVNIKDLGKWAGFADQYRCQFLDPAEPLFATIQKHYLQEQKKEFGTNHIYGVDPFNEVDPPSWEPAYLKKISANIYRSLTAVDSKAEWMQMGWFIYYDREDWTAPRVEAMLTGVPKGKMSLLDYHTEKTELWKTTQQFHGQPYIWCYLGNFGGNTAICGNVKECGERLDNALKNGGSNLIGIGSTLEGLDVQQFPYEYILEKAWTINSDNEQWINLLADRHAGMLCQPVREAWKLLFDEIYVFAPRTYGILPNFRPVMNGKNRRVNYSYSNKTLLNVWEKMLQVPQINRDALRLDIIVVGRQLIGNYFLRLKDDFDRMYEAKDIYALKARKEEMKEVLNDLDCLNAFHSRCSLEKWISDARDFGNTIELKDYYEKNARNLISTWGGNLNDYANRIWAGLIKDYYAKRWEMYFESVLYAAENGQDFNQKQLNKEIKQFEESWVDETTSVHVKPKGDLLAYARFLLKKYSERIY